MNRIDECILFKTFRKISNEISSGNKVVPSSIKRILKLVLWKTYLESNLSAYQSSIPMLLLQDRKG